LKEKGINSKVIISITILLPLAVAAMYFLPKSDNVSDVVKSIPQFNAFLNGTAFVTLVAGLVAIRSGKKEIHRALMSLAIMLSALFLVGYVTYHSQVESTEFGGEGMVRFVYFFILITHIILAASLAPMVLFTFTKAIRGDFKGHKRLAKWTYPIWLYVSLTGIIVYLMISPYYV
jgi:putative membrane protein